MAYTTQIHGLDASLLDRAAAVLSQVSDALAKRAVYRATLNELRQLNDRELNDLGLSRAGIRAVALDAAYGARD